MKRSLYSIILLLLFWFCALPSAVHAFSVNPLKYTATVDPGKSMSFTVNVLNDEKEAKRFQVGVQTLTLDAFGNRFYEVNKDIAEKWITSDAPSFQLKPGEGKAIHFKASPPPGTAPGAHLLALMIIAENTERQTIGLSARTAIPLSLTVAGTVTESLVISEWSAQKISTKNLLPLHIVLRNIGSAGVAASAKVQILSSNRKELIAEKVVSFGSAIYPQSTRQLDIEVELPSGKLPGPVNAVIDVEYGLSKTHVQASTRVWYLPIYALTGVGTVFLLVVSVLVWRRRIKKI